MADDKDGAIDEARATRWDAVVIGTGMGGATLGHALAGAGWRVLFCEKGYSDLAGGQDLRGAYAETFSQPMGVEQRPQVEVLARAGRWSEPMQDRSSGRLQRFVPFIGMGSGGSTALYGTALERFRRVDFTPSRSYPEATDANVCDWPIDLDELLPYYEAAERLFEVRGGRDPLDGPATAASVAVPRDVSAPARGLAEFLAHRGMHPYRLPYACALAEGCRGCQGFLCATRSKRDAARVCLDPAVASLGARLIDRCEAVRIEASADEVTSIVVRRAGQEFPLTARLFVLAAGALSTPALLLRSASPAWPDGLANRSGMVGRNLMRHYVDLYAVAKGTAQRRTGNDKEIALGDHYAGSAGKLGSFQAFGALPPVPVTLASMRADIANARGALAAAAFDVGKPVLGWLLRRIDERALVFASILEDLPFRDNRVFAVDDASGPTTAIHYRIAPGEAHRIARFRAIVRQMLSGRRFLAIRQAENNQRLAHACGTCRFGDDPRVSVLDRDNRAHGIANLYVVDASCFPSSGGTNPALTIAANALRVADRLVRAC